MHEVQIWCVTVWELADAVSGLRKKKKSGDGDGVVEKQPFHVLPLFNRRSLLLW